MFNEEDDIYFVSVICVTEVDEISLTRRKINVTVLSLTQNDGGTCQQDVCLVYNVMWITGLYNQGMRLKPPSH